MEVDQDHHQDMLVHLQTMGITTVLDQGLQALRWMAHHHQCTMSLWLVRLDKQLKWTSDMVLRQ